MRVLSRRFRTLFLSRRQAAQAGELRFSGTLAALAAPNAFAERLDTLRAVEWVFAVPSARSPDPSRCWPIPAAIPIAYRAGRARLTRLADGQVDFYLERLSPSRQDQGADARCRRVH